MTQETVALCNFGVSQESVQVWMSLLQVNYLEHEMKLVFGLESIREGYMNL